jgi:signal transduction histidine kinase
VHQELMRASHQAGMAEIATGVLHNVGNALNSVNISAEVLQGALNRSNFRLLRRITDLLRQNADNLPAFLSQDPRGTQIPGYLDTICTAAESGHEELRKELQDLRRHVEHICEVVAMQQEYARVGAVAEPAQVAELVEDALRMNATALGRSGIEVVREFDPRLPEISVQKHKVLQILVNFIQNAEYACRAAGREDRRIRIRTAAEGGGVRIDVIDNGIGLTAEAREKLFTYGYTTRPGGHGFGLHTGVLAARQLGGRIEARSDGPGLGATFTLIVPLAPPTDGDVETASAMPLTGAAVEGSG